MKQVKLVQTKENESSKKEDSSDSEQKENEKGNEVVKKTSYSLNATKYGEKQIETPPYDVIKLGLAINSTLKGKRRNVFRESKKEVPKGFTGNYWGISGSIFDPTEIESIRTYFQELLQRKRRKLKIPYRTFTEEEKEIGSQYDDAWRYFRLVPADKFFIVIDDRLLSLIQEQGFNFKEWYEEYKSLPENRATEEQWKNAKKIICLKERGNKIREKIETLHKIEKVTQLSSYVTHSELAIIPEEQRLRKRRAGLLKKLRSLDKEIDRLRISLNQEEKAVFTNTYKLYGFEKKGHKTLTGCSI